MTDNKSDFSTDSWDPRKAYKDKKIADNYDAMRFTSLTGRWGDFKEKHAFSHALDRIPQVRTALDAPCGTGRMTEVLLKRGLEVTGGDISREMMEHAKFKLHPFANRLKLEQVDLAALLFDSESFDLVTCVRLFGHFPSPKRVEMLKEMSRVTKRWVIVQYFCETRITMAKRWIKRNVLHTYEGVVHPVSEHVMIDELHQAGLIEEGRFWSRHY